MTGLRREDQQAFLAHLLERDGPAAIALALGLADDGVPVQDLLADLIGTAQVEVGELWQRNVRGVADEHAATAIADAVISVLMAHTAPPSSRRRLTLVCPDGEWHLLPARVVGESLRAAGHPVAFLGASLPADDLERFLSTAATEVLAVSCTTAAGLLGVHAAVAVAHRNGLPVLAGGRGLGSDDQRARALGADLWAPDARQAVHLLQEPLPLQLAASTAAVEPARRIQARRPAVVEAAIACFPEEWSAAAGQTAGHLVDCASGAALTGDPSIITEGTRWLATVHRARGWPDDLRTGCAAVVVAGVDDEDTALALAAER